MYLLSVSATNPQPLYQQVVEQIRARILSGDLPPGTSLPSVRQLAAEISTSVITTRRAYLELERQGLITTRPGLGTFVAQIPGERRKAIVMETLRAEVERLVARARELGASPQELVDLVQIVSAAQGADGSRGLGTDGRLEG